MLGLVSHKRSASNELMTSCLDDPELALLGVPWETYSQIALEIGLDVVR